MKNLTISLEATCDLPASTIKENEFEVLPMTYLIDGKEYSTNIDTVVSSGLYPKMRSGAKTSTSQINQSIYEEFFKSKLNDDNIILHLAFSSGLSDTYKNALAAANAINKDGQKRIYVIDSLCACSGHGMYAILVKKYAEKCENIDEIIDYAEKLKWQLNHCFTVDNLKYLVAGGRVKQTTAIFGSILNIKPVMRMDNEGHLDAVKKVISRKKSIKTLCDDFVKTHSKSCTLCYISHADCLSDAQLLATEIENETGIKPVITDLGPIIGCHSGPGTLSLYYLADRR